MKLLHAENGGVVLYVNAWKRVCSTCRPIDSKTRYYALGWRNLVMMVESISNNLTDAD